MYRSLINQEIDVHRTRFVSISVYLSQINSSLCAHFNWGKSVRLDAIDAFICMVPIFTSSSVNCVFFSFNAFHKLSFNYNQSISFSMKWEIYPDEEWKKIAVNILIQSGRGINAVKGHLHNRNSSPSVCPWMSIKETVAVSMWLIAKVHIWFDLPFKMFTWTVTHWLLLAKNFHVNKLSSIWITFFCVLSSKSHQVIEWMFAFECQQKNEMHLFS